ncbi:MAG: radical SAM protein [Desulfobacteraceae bacterium]|jgi:histone acetyltransferase (RNA polymerase elongator complex component)
MNHNATQKPFVIPIFIPHAGCPHRCVFCDQTRTTSHGEQLPGAAQLDETITRFLGYRKDAARYTEISFYGGNFLGLSNDNISFFLESATRYVCDGRVQGIRFSTRPDTITGQRLKLLTRFPVTTIELGVQSMNDQVLSRSRRGHTAQNIHHAVTLLKRASYRLGLQMMVGLPGDTTESAMATGEQIAQMGPDFVRIYPTLVLGGSRLAEWYRKGRYHPMDLEEAVALVKKLYVLFVRRQIKVVRMGLQATDGFDTGEDLVAGPFHPAFGELVHSALWLEAITTKIRNISLRDRKLTIGLNPRLVSRVKGHHGQNIKILAEEFSLPQIELSTDNRLPLNAIQLNGQLCHPIKALEENN